MNAAAIGLRRVDEDFTAADCRGESPEDRGGDPGVIGNQGADLWPLRQAGSHPSP